MTGNNKHLISDCSDELKDIKSFIKDNPFNSMVRHLVAYSVIKSCGTIEIIFKDIIYNHLTKDAGKEATYFFSRNIKESSINPKTGKISNLLEQINPEWKNNFESYIKGSTDKGSLNSLVDLRNQLAHGGCITASIDDVIGLFHSGCNILNILDNIVK